MLLSRPGNLHSARSILWGNKAGKERIPQPCPQQPLQEASTTENQPLSPKPSASGSSATSQSRGGGTSRGRLKWSAERDENIPAGPWLKSCFSITATSLLRFRSGSFKEPQVLGYGPIGTARCLFVMRGT